MNESELMGFLRANRQREIEELKQWRMGERATCVPLVRVHQLARNPSEATAEENAQFAHCPHCAHLLAQMRQIVPQQAPESV